MKTLCVILASPLFVTAVLGGVEYGETCGSDSVNCLGICQNDICRVKADEDCSADPQHCVMNATCDNSMDPDTCKCTTGWSTIESGDDMGTCGPAPTYVGGTCTDTCQDSHATCQGDPKTCQCNTGYERVMRNNTCQVADGQLNGDCKAGNVCDAEHTMCSNNTCVCEESYIPNEAGNACVAEGTGLGQLYGGCKPNNVCDAEHTTCVNNICGCESGFNENTTGDACDRGAAGVVVSVAVLFFGLMTSFVL